MKLSLRTSSSVSDVRTNVIPHPAFLRVIGVTTVRASLRILHLSGLWLDPTCVLGLGKLTCLVHLSLTDFSLPPDVTVHEVFSHDLSVFYWGCDDGFLIG